MLWRGCVDWLDGSHDRAHAAWRGCIEQAERFGLAYESARAHYEIGRHLDRSDPERSAHLTRAESEFHRLLMEPDVRRVRAVLYAA
jgi:hypothetical protein